MLEAIHRQNIPASQLPCSPAIRAAHFAFVSGQASVAPSGRFVSGSFEVEATAWYGKPPIAKERR